MVTDKHKVEIALEWLSADRARRSLSEEKGGKSEQHQTFWPARQSELNDRLDELLQTPPNERINKSRRIKRVLLEAFADGLVELRQSRIAPKYRWGGGAQNDRLREAEFDPALEGIAAMFKEVFRPLGFSGEVIVVDASAAQENGTQDLHMALGDACAREIYSRKLFAEYGPRIAWGSGRGAAYTQERLYELYGSDTGQTDREVHLMSLSGNLFSGPFDDGQYLVDADLVTSLSARLFRSNIQLEKTNCPLANSTDETNKLINRTWLGQDFREASNCPTLAIFGIGALAPEGQHRLNIEMRRLSDSTHVPSDVIDMLRALQDEVAGLYRAHKIHAIADIANRLFFVDPLPSTPNPEAYEARRDEITTMVNEINAHMVTIKKRDLHRTLKGANVLVAGGEDKIPGLFTILTRRFNHDDVEFNIPIKLLVSTRKDVESLIEAGSSLLSKKSR